MRIGHAIEHQQQRRTFGPIEQLLEHGLAPDLAGADLGHHALMHALGQFVEQRPRLGFHRQALTGGQLQQGLDPRLTPPFGDPELLHPPRMEAQQRFHGVDTVDGFQLAHASSLGRAWPLR